MNNLETFFQRSCYGMPQAEKEEIMLAELQALEQWHQDECEAYRSIREAYGICNVGNIEEMPFLPVRLFKELELKSVNQKNVFKTLTSSGTTGQAPSKIFLDSETSKLQTKTLVKIVQTFIGKKRLPMIIVDHPGVIKNRESFSARGAGILGLYNFGRNHTFALTDQGMNIDVQALQDFTEAHSGQPILIFGFTFMVWKYFVLALEQSGVTLDLSNACLIHSGGWKKLEDEAVSSNEFKRRLKTVSGINKVHNFYGMVEQVGSIFMECEAGHLHAPIFSDVIIRDPQNWKVLGVGETGVIQVLSILPRSYPGHSLMTEDRGTLIGEDDCSCGRLGRYFNVQGRLPMAEVRGCSDTHDQVAVDPASINVSRS